MRLGLSVCMDRNRAIGKGNTIPWHSKKDMTFFRMFTMGKPLIMGRNTYQSILESTGEGQILPGREVVVLSKSMEEYPTIPNVEVCWESSEALNYSMRVAENGIEGFDYSKIRPKNGTFENFPIVCGGQSVYEEFLPKCTDLFINTLDIEVHGADRFFPELTNVHRGMQLRKERKHEGIVYRWFSSYQNVCWPDESAGMVGWQWERAYWISEGFG